MTQLQDVQGFYNPFATKLDIKKYRKKPIIIEAIRYTGDNKGDVRQFTKGQAITNTGYSHMTIPTLEGDHRADIGDWIIKGVKGEFYPCKSDIFDQTYDVVSD